MIPRRLDKFLADATRMSRVEIYRALEDGRIAVQPASHDAWHHALAPWGLIFAEDRVLLDGEEVRLREVRHYYALHKPEGVLSATSDPHGRETLAPWLAGLPDGVFPVGRLDRATTGFMLLTDDGDLCYCLLRPWFGVAKEYHLTVRGRVEAEDVRLSQLVEGVEIGDGKPAAAALSVGIVRQIAPGMSQTLENAGHWLTVVSVEVDEGRNRMVRRMARAVGLGLAHLHRPRIGPVELGAVAPGECRALCKAEVDALWQVSGGREDARRRHVAALQRHAQQWRHEGRPHARLEAWLSLHSESEY